MITMLKKCHCISLIICESNSLRNVVIPGTFIIFKNTKSDIIKKSAGEVMDKADVIVENDFIKSIKNKKIEIKNQTQSFFLRKNPRQDVRKSKFYNEKTWIFLIFNIQVFIFI